MKIEFSPSPEQVRLIILGVLILLGVHHKDLLLLVGL